MEWLALAATAQNSYCLPWWAAAVIGGGMVTVISILWKKLNTVESKWTSLLEELAQLRKYPGDDSDES